MAGRCFLALAAIAMAVATAGAGSPYYVSDRSGGEIYRIRDLNGDGDALDAGENVLWADGMVQAIELTTDGCAIFAVDRGANRIMRYADTNGDGDALDAGEATVWADGLDNPYGITMAAGGAVYYTEYSAGEVGRLRDLNGDGDALDAGERVTYARSVGFAISVMARPDDLVVSSFVGDKIYRVRDLNGDGDALDVGETLDFTPPLIYSAHGLLLDAAGGFFAGARDTDTVYRVRDRNGDGDAFDVIEVLSYADNVFGGLDGPWGMAGYSGGGFLLAEYLGDKVSLVRDLNGDGDALDVGEAVRFADGVDAVGIVSMPDPGTVGYNNVEIVSGAGNWNISHTNVFQSYGDGAELGVARIVGNMTGGAGLSVVTSAGGYNNEQGNLTLSTPLDYGGTGTNALTLSAAGTVRIDHPVTDSTPGGDSLDLTVHADAEGNGTGTVDVNAAVSLGGGRLTSTGVDFDNTGGPITAGQALFNHTGTVTLGALLEVGSGAVRIDGGTLDINTTTGGTINLTANNLIVDYTGNASPFSDIAAWVASGFRDGPAGYWDGPGITSSTAAAMTLTALAVIDNGDPNPKIGGLPHLEGEPVSAESVLVKYTWWGDANLDGVIDSNDYDLIDNTFALYDPANPAPPAGGWRWAVGDFTYDGVVDSNDYDRIDNAFVLQTGALGRLHGGPVATPEPATLALLAAGLGALVVRKRRT